MNYHPKIIKALSRYERKNRDTEPPAKFPLLEAFKTVHPSEGLFSDVDALFIQHHLGDLIPHIEAMVPEGLDRCRCWFADIPYSTNEMVRGLLETRGYKCEHMTGFFSDPLEDYDSSQSSRITYFMQRLAQRDSPKPLLVIDDGGHFVRFLKSAILHAPDLIPAFQGSYVVEQTTRGHRFLKKYKSDVVEPCKLSVVSIARCYTKKNYESPFVGEAVSRALVHAVGEDRLADMRYVAVIGFGAVGRATVSQLTKWTKRALIDIVDIDEEALRCASSFKSHSGNRCRGLKELAANRQYELVVGCTGYNSFRIDQRGLLADDAILASGSSAAVEFNRTGFIELADRRPDDEIRILNRIRTRKKGIHAPIVFSHEGRKTFCFLNAGFPINFDGHLECMPAQFIQATHCLLYAASLQALQEKPAGLNKIREEYDKWIFKNALDEL